MREWLRKLQGMAVGAAFAEEGEWKMAQSILNEWGNRPVKRRKEFLRKPRTRVREHSYRL